MARKAILDTYYTFTPSTRTVVIPRAVPRERLILITNVTTNQVIFNFSDASLKTTSYTISTDGAGNAITTAILNYNTTSMSATDKLQIVIDEYDEKFTPSETYTDPVNKLRVSTPQALIDTDFEYSTQSTKWESLGMINNRPFAYYSSGGSALTVTNITATNGSRVITVATTTPPAAGTPVFIQDTIWQPADGSYIVDTVSAGTNFTYTARLPFNGATGSIFNSSATSVYTGTPFTNAAIGVSTVVANGTNASNVQITTSIPHGLMPGNEVALTGTSASTFAPNGSWVISTVANATSFSIYPTSAPTGSITGGTLYTRPQGQLLHRAYDGGIQFSNFSFGPNETYMRQTRRYFRYQSGKGIQVSTGTLMKPSLNIDQIISSGNTVTVYTKQGHNMTPGVTVVISGCNETAYNGTFTVATVIDAFRFTYTAGSTPSAATATGTPQVSLTSWYGSQARVGLFDQQNGLFFEFDGQTLFAVRRSSTYQLAGTVSVTTSSCTVTGVSNQAVNTLFSKQLTPGDFIVLKGMSYRVQSIASDTSLTISPAYRGPTASNVVITKTIDTKIPQSQWNIDRCDGTGPSGFNMDLARMQMFYMDYSWYGAGFIRWGFRGADGNVIYCHRLVNNNVNYEAYMRSGNLPGHYEVTSTPKSSILTQTMSSANTTCYVSDLSGWPASGAAFVKSADGVQFELINYSAISQDYSLTFALTAGSTTATGTNTTGLLAGMYVQGNSIPAGTTVQTVNSGASIVMSQPATITTGNVTLLFNPRLTGLTRAQTGGNLTVGTTANSVVATAASTSGVQIGQAVVGTGIPPGTFVTNVSTNSNVTLNYATTATGSITATFIPAANTTAQTYTYSATAPASIELFTVSQQAGPIISHWGTSVIMDGRYDDDKSFVFTQGTTTALTIVPGLRAAVQSFRVSPSVSNGITGTSIGTREIVNRMQMVLRQLDLFSNGNFLVSLILNGSSNIGTPSWTSVGGSSLAQYVNHSANTAVSGGETIYGFFLNASGGATNFTATQQELDLVRDLGTSILSGGTTVSNTGTYPDGPDVVTVVAQNIGTANANLFCRMSWTEAQA